jgi:HSP20 family protein
MKTLTMYRPFTIGNALSDFDRCLESFFGDSPLTPVDRVFNHLPAVDIQEKEDSYVLEAELPGYDEKDIRVQVEGGNLSIESSRETEAGQKENGANAGKGTYLIRERRSSSFSRSFKLPENADPSQVAASFKNGVLSMEIKKRGEAQKRLIRINSSGGGE